MRFAPRTAVSLYVALAVHGLLLLGLALSPPSQNPSGPGLGLSIPGAGLDAAERRLATARPPDRQPDEAEPAGDTSAAMSDAVDRSAPKMRVDPVSPQTGSRPARAEKSSAPAQYANTDARVNHGDDLDGAGRVGGGGGPTYFARLRVHLAGFRRELPGGLPAATARVRVRVSPDGWISQLELLESSGLAALDAEALDLLRRAAPLPPPPPGRATRLIVPVSIGGPDSAR